MTSLPLHPAVVHLPLGLAFVMPALALGFAWALWTGRIRPRARLALVALQALLLGAGLVAMNTGEREEDRVERIVPDTALHTHEAAAEPFVWATGLTLVLIGLVPLVRQPVATRTLTAVSVAANLVHHPRSGQRVQATTITDTECAIASSSELSNGDRYFLLDRDLKLGARFE